MSNTLHPCPCCGYLQFDEPPGSYAFCEICWWEDDFVQLRFPWMGGANIPLIEAQKNFAAFGASTPGDMDRVRRPIEKQDRQDAGWRLFDPALDRLDSPPEGEGGQFWQAVLAADEDGPSYYWRR